MIISHNHLKIQNLQITTTAPDADEIPTPEHNQITTTVIQNNPILIGTSITTLSSVIIYTKSSHPNRSNN